MYFDVAKLGDDSTASIRNTYGNRYKEMVGFRKLIKTESG
jgi:hypothetical protein